MNPLPIFIVTAAYQMQMDIAATESITEVIPHLVFKLGRAARALNYVIWIRRFTMIRSACHFRNRQILDVPQNFVSITPFARSATRIDRELEALCATG